MSELFLTVLNMSLTASYVILFVILIRLLLKKVPKVISYALWGVVAFRLIIPFSFESMFSLMPRNTNAVPIPHDIIYQQSPQINSGIGVVDSFVSESLPAPTIGASVNPLQIYVEIGAYIWVFGIIALLIYSLVSILILKRQLKSAQIIENNIFEAKNLKTPFVLGLIKPKIYLPVGLNATERSYILLHEQTHIHRKDHIIKVLAFLTLSVHWFNPLVWIAFMLMSTDMELSCDERVLKEMHEDIKKPYANSLLSLAIGRRILNGSPLAFGEGNVRGRIKNVLNYKRPRFWVVLVSVIILIGTCITLLSNPAVSKQDLSMLNIKNLAKLSYQKNELLVSRTPGKNEGFNVSARAIAEYLDNAKWSEKKMDSPLELSADLQIEWNEDQELRFFESEPLLAMVRMNEQWRYYTIGQNDYETMLSIIETASSPSGTTDVAYHTEYDRVRIEFLSDMMGFKSANQFETTHSPIVAYIDSTLRTSLTPVQEDDLENNHTNQYSIKLSNDIGGYSCKLYYDTLYNKAYIVKDGGLYELGTDFARYIDSFLENSNIDFYIDDADVVALFQTYGWTLDYQISAMNNKLNNINVLTGFNPNAYYFAYNNELSKDVGLDMNGYSNSANIDVKIYRIHESMPQEFYPIQDSRGIVVKKDDKIIGAFISAGRHSVFNACSLRGNSFEKVTGKTIYGWLNGMVRADNIEERLSKLEPEQVIQEYFTALDNKDAKLAGYCISKKALLGNLTSNIQNEELFNEGIGLPLTDSDIGAKSSFDNLKSTKLFNTELIDEPDKNTKIFRVTVNLQYKKELTISSGEQFWDCRMVYETPQTGWKIEGFGH
ncbi:M56 family metallopeptidase [Anaerobium acetethylicum]|uniref:Signal transducer regulating beta-lactamase production, contains metallopeptidase domain n=1 Tax=Anaerobium acetethylicum TaxID=1619234 RepID=A0A1D3TU19_9FIRM|nr:M56 family metallopeptidase [Anaerobium acetethylicum]SCP97465.1 Signal transducer regulating beta-lactamase production, contains metallopeptidase domain [Anaerobium acetethylicum]